MRSLMDHEWRSLLYSRANEGHSAYPQVPMTAMLMHDLSASAGRLGPVISHEIWGAPVSVSGTGILPGAALAPPVLGLCRGRYLRARLTDWAS